MPVRRTPAAQLDREIAESLARAAPKSRHSEKALTTLSIMGTRPEQWQLTPIEWREELREVPGLITCPVCHGRKFVRIVDGQVIPPPDTRAGWSADHEYSQEARRDAFRANKRHGNCPRCGVFKRGWGEIPQGKVKGMVRREVMVGYPQFPPGTRFDSRFSGGSHCNLCSKSILKSGRVPVHGTGDNGVTHGMWVGEDCARKFLDVRLKRPEDSVMESGNAPV